MNHPFCPTNFFSERLHPDDVESILPSYSPKTSTNVCVSFVLLYIIPGVSEKSDEFIA